MKKRYAIAIMAIKYNGIGLSGEASSMPAIVHARNKDEAREISERACREQYPESEGWLNHQSSIIEIPEA